MGKRKYNPVIGTRYGTWVVVSNKIYKNGDKDRTTYFMVKCNCGRQSRRAAHLLVNNKTKACKSCCKTANNNNSMIQTYFKKMLRRANKSSFKVNVDMEYLEQLIIKQNFKCALSGLNIEFKPLYLAKDATASLDRIDSSKGYIKGNVQWVHKDINFMKNKLKIDKFLELCSIIHYYNKHSKC